MSGTTIGLLIVIVVYLIGMVGIGIKYSKTTKDVTDFYLGGRRLGPLVTAMSAEASDMSSYLLMGLPGLAYLTGLADVGWTVIGLAAGTYLNWLIVSKRLRRYTAKTNSITLPDFLSNRYQDSSHLLLAISALIIVIFFVPYTASGFAACGKLFSALFDIPYIPAMLVSAVIIVSYTSLGGYLAASTTDLIQSIIMTSALIIVVIFGIHLAGGVDTVIDNAKALEGYMTMFATHDQATQTSSPYGFLKIVSTLAWGLGYFGMPHILLRFMGCRDENELKLSRRIASIWVVISMSIAVFIGIMGYTLSKNGSIDTLTGSSESETLIIKIAILLSKHGILAIILGGLILAGILACTMSTADSQLLAASSSISQNLLRDTFGVRMTEKSSMTAARLTVIGIAVIAAFIARDPNSSVFNIVSFAWAGFGAAFGPVILFALFWKRSNRYGALAGMIAGGLMVFVWKYLIAPMGGAWAIYELLPAFIVNCIIIVIVSLLTPAPDKKIQNEFEKI